MVGIEETMKQEQEDKVYEALIRLIGKGKIEDITIKEGLMKDGMGDSRI